MIEAKLFPKGSSASGSGSSTSGPRTWPSPTPWRPLEPQGNFSAAVKMLRQLSFQCFNSFAVTMLKYDSLKVFVQNGSFSIFLFKVIHFNYLALHFPPSLSLLLLLYKLHNFLSFKSKLFCTRNAVANGFRCCRKCTSFLSFQTVTKLCVEL